MTINSKYEIDTIVWFFARQGNEAARVYEGRIAHVDRWDRWDGFVYNISRLLANDSTLDYFVNEKDIYLTREEAEESIFVPSEVNLTNPPIEVGETPLS